MTKILANWKPFERRPTWGYVSVQEVAQALNISPQSVHNWVGRGKLPKAEKKPKFRGNKGFFQIARIRSFLEGRSEEEIHWEWINKMLPEHAKQFKTIGEAQFLVKYGWEVLGVEKA